MKKILTIVMMACLPFLLAGQVIITPGSPYAEDFEGGPAGWTSGGTSSTWAFGTPAKTVITGAASGVNAWTTGGTGTGLYNAGEDSWVESPVFDLSDPGLVQQRIKLSIWYEAELSWDGANVQYTTDGGTNWNLIGNNGDPDNWYNDGTINSAPGGDQEGWTGRDGGGSGGYVSAIHDLPVSLSGNSAVSFRVFFAADGSGQDDGFAFDDFELFELPADDLAIDAVAGSFGGNLCQFGTAETITITISNLGTADLPAGTMVPVSYSVDGGAAVNEVYTLAAILPSLGTTMYTFTTPADLTGATSRTVSATVSLGTDGLAGNNSNATSVSLLAGPFVAITPTNAYNEDFEGGMAGWTSDGTNSSWALGTPANTEIIGAASGTNAWATDLTGIYNAGENSWVQSPVFDFSDPALVQQRVRFDIWWESENSFDGANLQYSADGGTTWILIGANGDPDNWYNDGTISGNPGGSQIGWTGRDGGGSGGYVTAVHDLPSSLSGTCGVLFRVFFGSDGSLQDDGFAFDNFEIFELPTGDLALDEVTGTFTQNLCQFGTAETVTITLSNEGTAALPAGTMVPVSYSVDGGPAVNETITLSAPLASMATLMYTFLTPADLSGAASRTVSATVSFIGDAVPANNTNSVTTDLVTGTPQVVNSANPYMEDFEGGMAGWTSGGTNSSWAFGTPAKSEITGAASGTNAWVTNLTGSYNVNENSWVQSPPFDFSDPSLVQQQVSFDIWWESENSFDGTNLQYSTDGGATWILIGANGDPDNWYNRDNLDGRVGGQADGWSDRNGNGSNGYVTAIHDLPSSLSGTCGVLFRVFFGSDGSAQDDGFAFDNFMVIELAANDLAVDNVTGSFVSSLCQFGTAETVTITILNLGTSDQPAGTMVPVSYSVDGGPAVNETITLPAPLLSNESLMYTFTSNANLTGATSRTISATVSLPSDQDANNNTNSVTTSLVPGPIGVPTAGTPYVEDFEGGANGWTSGGTGNSWALGTPANTVIQGAASGQNAWATNLTGLYNVNENSWVQSVGIDLSDPSLATANVKVDIWWEAENSFDGANLQYSTDGGATWTLLGALGDPDNWYNDGTISGEPGGSQIGWTGRDGGGSNGYLTAEHPLPASLVGQCGVLFRIFFGSDGSVQDDGFAFDNFTIYQPLQFDVALDPAENPANGIGGSAATSACGKGATETVSITFSNEGVMDLAAGTVLTAILTVDGALQAIENFSLPATLASGSTTTYNFTATADLSASGTHTIAATINFPNDENAANNGTSITAESIANINTLATTPYLEDFENGMGGWNSGGTNSSWEFGTPNDNTIQGASSGANAWETNLTGNYNANESSWVESPVCFDFSDPCLLRPTLQMDIWYESEFSWDGTNVQYTSDGGATWNLIGVNGDPNNWYNDNSSNGPAIGGDDDAWSGQNGSGSNGWVTATHALPAGIVGNSAVAFRVFFAADGSGQDDGFAFDNVSIFNNCLSGSDLTSCSNGNPLDLINQVSGADGSGTWSGPSALGNGAQGTLDPSALGVGTYTFSYSEGPASSCNCLQATVVVIIVNGLDVSQIDYNEGFENGPNGWASGGTNSSWELGMPNAAVIQGAADGQNAWATNLTGPYNSNEDSYVESPGCFDFSNPCMQQPSFSADIWYESEFNWDGANLQYSDDGGTTWNLVGNVGDPNNWYNDGSVNGAPGGESEGWSGSGTRGTGGWVTAQHDLNPLLGKSGIAFRFHFGSDAGFNLEGFAFDNVKVEDNYLQDGELAICENADPVDLFDFLEGNPAGGGVWTGPSVVTNGGRGTFDPNTMQAGIYSYSEDINNQCPCLRATVTVTKTPAPNAGTSTSISVCASTNPIDLLDELVGADAGGTWMGPGMLANGDQGTFDPAVDPAGVYVYTASSAGCNDVSASVTVSVSPAPAAPIVSNISACDGESTIITPTPVVGISFNYYDADPGTPGANLLASGASYDPGTLVDEMDMVWVTAFDGQCDSDPAVVSVSVLPLPTPAASSNSPLFIDQTLNLSGSGGVSYMWTGPNGFSSAMQNPQIANIQQADCGVYTLTVTGANGCSNSVTIAVLAVPAAVTLSPRIILEGAYDTNTKLMRTNLQQQNLVPTIEPYSAMGYTHRFSGAQVTTGVLSGANAQSQGDKIVDWVLIELRDQNDPKVIVVSRPGLLQSDGDIVDLDGMSPVAFGAAHAAAGNYYVSIRHRNHLGVMTEKPVALSVGGVSPDFSDPATKTFGKDAEQTLNGVNLLWAGDVFNDGELRYSGPGNDRAPILSIIGGVDPTSVGKTGYKTEDVNMDGLTKYSGPSNDRSIILDNIGGTDATNVKVEQVPK